MADFVEEVPESLAGERVDRVVAMITGRSRSEVVALVAEGQVSLDGVVVAKGSLRLPAGSVVTVSVPDVVSSALPVADPSVIVPVVHADDEVIVVDKPAGLVVHPGAGNPSGTLVNGLLARYPEIAGVGEMHRPGIVHRLDVGTSGLMVVARTELAYHSLVEALASRDVGRVYRALVWGHLDNPVGVIDAPIGRDHRDPMRMSVVVDGKPARTRYRVLGAYRTPAAVSVVECRLETGRTHQIRVHLSAIGHPVVGDGQYGGIRSAIDSPRPFLHAAGLELVHPSTGESLAFSSPLPADLAGVEAVLSDKV